MILLSTLNTIVSIRLPHLILQVKGTSLVLSLANTNRIFVTRYHGSYFLISFLTSVEQSSTPFHVGALKIGFRRSNKFHALWDVLSVRVSSCGICAQDCGGCGFSSPFHCPEVELVTSSRPLIKFTFLDQLHSLLFTDSSPTYIFM